MWFYSLWTATGADAVSINCKCKCALSTNCTVLVNVCKLWLEPSSFATVLAELLLFPGTTNLQRQQNVVSQRRASQKNWPVCHLFHWSTPPMNHCWTLQFLWIRMKWNRPVRLLSFLFLLIFCLLCFVFFQALLCVVIVVFIIAFRRDPTYQASSLNCKVTLQVLCFCFTISFLFSIVIN